ncbi:MAG: twin-arginine translocase TatA/TatE family subunit [Armatimonadetes bacterium]|nr:twin-arginine translocase TatA/TatE family subunit [Armatimonadota bacterium]
MPNIGFPELVIILVVVLLLFGPKRLPDFARSMGQAIREFRRASQEVIDDIQRESLDDRRSPRNRSGDDEARSYAEQAESEGAKPGPTTTRQL